MSKRSRFDTETSPHSLAALTVAVGALCPDLSPKARPRIGEMALAMHEASAFDEGCTRSELLAADFTAAEIASGWILARAALDHIKVPVDTLPAFAPADVVALARFAARQRTVEAYR